jgi:hypothetical protein
LRGLKLAGNRERVFHWLGDPAVSPAAGLRVEYTDPAGTPGLMSVTFDTPKGTITL